MKRRTPDRSEDEEEEEEKDDAVRKHARRHEDPLLSALDRISSIPLALHRDQAVVHVDDIRNLRGPEPQSDGLLRDPKTGKPVNEDVAFNPDWRKAWLERERSMLDNEDYQFLELLAGALHTRIDALLDLDTMLLERRSAAELEAARRVELQELRKSVDDRIKDLRNAQAYLEDLRAVRVVEQAGIADISRRWLRDGNLASLLRISNGGLLFPFYMLWQYKFIDERIGSGNPPGDDRGLLTDADIEKLAFIVNTDLTLGLVDDDDVDAILLALGKREEPRKTDAEIRAETIDYVVTRDVARVNTMDVRMHNEPELVMPDALNDRVVRALRLGYSNLPGISPLAPVLVDLDVSRGEATIPLKEPRLRFPWFTKHGGIFSTPFAWAGGDRPLVPALPLTEKEDAARDRRFAYAELPPYGGERNGVEYQLLNTESDALRRRTAPAPPLDIFGPKRLSDNMTMLGHLTRHSPPTKNPFYYYLARRYFPTALDYAIVCEAITTLVGPLLLHAFDDIFASATDSHPLFSIPSRDIPNELQQRVAALKVIAGKDVPPVDPLRFRYTTDASPSRESLLLGDMLAYVHYNRDAITAPSAATLWLMGDKSTTIGTDRTNVVTPILALGDLALNKAALDKRFSHEFWDAVAGVGRDTKEIMTNNYISNPQAPIGDLIKRQFETSEPRVIRDVVLPILFEGGFSHQIALLGQQRPLRLDASYWPLTARPIVIPAQEAKDKIDQKLLGRLSADKQKVYVDAVKAGGMAWATADFGEPTVTSVKFLQEMCPIAVLPLMADMLVAFFANDDALKKEIDDAQKIVDNLQDMVDEVTNQRDRLKALSDTTQTLHQACTPPFLLANLFS